MTESKWSDGPISDGSMDPRNKFDRGEVVVTFNMQGQIVAVTRQDQEGRILSVIAESAERIPVAWMRGEHTPSDSQWGYYSPMKCYDDDIPLYR
jgi:hypothetical protein